MINGPSPSPIRSGSGQNRPIVVRTFRCAQDRESPSKNGRSASDFHREPGGTTSLSDLAWRLGELVGSETRRALGAAGTRPGSAVPMNFLVTLHASLPKNQAQTVRSWKGRAGASHSGRDTVRRIRGFLSPKSPEGQLETRPRDSREPSRGEEPCHGRLRGGGAGFGAGTGSGCTGVADDGAPVLAIALISAAILVSIVLS
jgi:hypothetical protein